MKVWELDSIEEKSEFFTPKKECTALDVLGEMLVCGYSDGFVRFYDYTSFHNIG